jgi:hypothetical protein
MDAYYTEGPNNDFPQQSIVLILQNTRKDNSEYWSRKLEDEWFGPLETRILGVEGADSESKAQ